MMIVLCTACPLCVLAFQPTKTSKIVFLSLLNLWSEHRPTAPSRGLPIYIAPGRVSSKRETHGAKG